MLFRILLLLLAILPAPAQVSETQHNFDFSFDLPRRLELDLNFRFRTRPSESRIRQFRLGPTLDFAIHPRLSLQGGYYWRNWEGDTEEWISGHRLFAGAGIWSNRRSALSARSHIERFPAEQGAIARFRERLQVQGRGRLSPIVSSEGFFDTKGWRGTRLRGVLRWRPNPANVLRCRLPLRLPRSRIRSAPSHVPDRL